MIPSGHQRISKVTLHWILALFVFLVLLSTVLKAQPAGYEHRKLLTLNSSEISGSTAHTNFPVLIELTENDLRTTSNGGGVRNPSGFDIIFTAADGSTLLDHELQNYTGSTGNVLAWVRVPSLSPSSDTDIYLYFGNSDVYSDQSVSSTWDNDYLGVWHMEDLTDASPNAYTLTDHNTAVNASGYLGSAREFDGDGDDLETLEGATFLNGWDSLTVSMWVKADAIGSDRGLLYGDDPDGNDRRLMIRQDAAGESGGGTNVYRTAFLLGNNNRQRLESSNGSATTSWQYLTMVRIPGSDTQFYIDGSLDPASWSNSKSGSTNQSTKLLLGKGSKDGATSSWDGLMDEVRILRSALSSDWIATEYSNMTDPATFHTVSTANELPNLNDIESIALSYQANDPQTIVTNSISCQDYSEFNLDSAKVQISGNYVSTEDTLIFSTAYGISGTFLDGSGTLLMMGNASLEDYSSALQEVYYFNSNPVPDASTRTISFSVSDGDGYSATVTRDITMNAVNNAPTLSSLEGSTIAYTDGDPDTVLTSTLAISDIDDYYLESATVTISSNFVSGEDVLDCVNTGAITPAWSNITGVLTLSGTATVSEYEGALHEVTYHNLNPDPAETTRSISFEVFDGDDYSNVLSRDLSVTAVNDAPILSGIEGKGIVYNAGDGPVAITDSIIIYDGDDTKIDSASVQISTNFYAGEDTLEYNSIYGITGTWYGGSGQLKLSGKKSLASYETVLRSIQYENLLTSPHTSTRTISFVVHDGDTYSDTLTRTISAGAPATLSGLQLWLNGKEGIFTDNGASQAAVDGDDVQVWEDQSGNARDFTNSSGAPLWRESVAGLNGESAVEFSGGGESMQDADGENYINGMTALTSFFVIKSDLTSTDKGFWTARTAGAGDREFSLRYDAVGDNSGELRVIKAAVSDDVVANELEGVAEIQTTNAQIVCLDWDAGTVWDLYVDGVLNNPSYSGDPPSAAISGSNRALVGRGPEDGSGSWDGMVAEVILYDRHLSDSERQLIEDYLSDKYAISVRLLEPASGGEAISADDAGGSYTTLTGPRITEDVSGELSSGGTIVLNAPAGFEWDTGGSAPSVATQEAYGSSTALTLSFTSRTSSALTFTVGTESNSGSQPGEVIFSDIRVRPSSATIPNSGVITNSGTTGPTGVTSFGELVMVAGAPSKVAFLQQSGNGTLDEILTPEFTAAIQDANDNILEIPGTQIDMAISMGSATLGGTTTLYTDASGITSFNDLTLDNTGDFKLSASSSGVTSAVSDTISVSDPGQFTGFLIEKLSGGNILSQTAGSDFNVKISAVDGSLTVDTDFTGTVDISSSGALSNGSGTTAAFIAGVLASHTVAISSIGTFELIATHTAGSETTTSNSFAVVAGPPSAVESEITATPTVLENNAVSTSTIRVLLKDAGGNALSTGGATIYLLASAGTLLGSLTDHGDGSYTQLLRSSSSVETAVITGVLNGNAMSDDASVQFNAYSNIWESDPGNDPYTSEWEDVLNWDTGVPDYLDAVLVPAEPADGTKYPIISVDNQQVASLTIESTADVSISGNISFDILGDLGGAGDINAGSLDTLRVGGDLAIGSSSLQYVELNGSSLQTLQSPLSFANLEIDNASGVKVTGDLTVSGTLTLTNGSLIIPSGKSLIANTKSLGSGTIRAEREIIGDTGWRLLASPVTSTYGDLFNNIFTQGYTGSDSADGSPSVLYYDESYAGTDNQRWRKPASTATATVPGLGLFVYVFGSIIGETAYSDPLPVTLDVTGDEEEGTAGSFDFGVTYTASADTGWNLIGNPFAATIDWDAAGWTKTNMDNVIYVWDNTANSGEGGYLTWNGTAGSLGDGLIKPFQGFWVKANAAGPTLSVPKSAKTTGGVFYKQAAAAPLMVFLLEADTLSASMHIQFDEDASMGKDSKDAFLLIPPTDTFLELYSVSRDNDALTIQNHPIRFGQKLEIEIGVDGFIDGEGYAGPYRLSWPRMDDLPLEWNLVLEDTETGEQVDMSQQAYYEFSSDEGLGKSIPSLRPAKGFLNTETFSLRKRAASKRPRFILHLDPGNAFPEIPREFGLGNNYPNPFNDGTTIIYALPLESEVSLTIYDIRGRQIERIMDRKHHRAGNYSLRWQNQRLSSGVYFYRLSVNEQVFTKKMMLIK
jgi:hypothetical protein